MSTSTYVRDQDPLLPASVLIMAFRFRTHSLNATAYFRRALAVPEAGKPGLASSAPASDLHLVGTNYQLIASLCRNERSLPPAWKGLAKELWGLRIRGYSGLNDNPAWFVWLWAPGFFLVLLLYDRQTDFSFDEPGPDAVQMVSGSPWIDLLLSNCMFLYFFLFFFGEGGGLGREGNVIMSWIVFRIELTASFILFNLIRNNNNWMANTSYSACMNVWNETA